MAVPGTSTHSEDDASTLDGYDIQEMLKELEAGDGDAGKFVDVERSKEVASIMRLFGDAAEIEWRLLRSSLITFLQPAGEPNTCVDETRVLFCGSGSDESACTVAGGADVGCPECGEQRRLTDRSRRCLIGEREARVDSTGAGCIASAIRTTVLLDDWMRVVQCFGPLDRWRFELLLSVCRLRFFVPHCSAFDAHVALEGQQCGACVLRLSQHYAGVLWLAFVDEAGQRRHVFIRNEGRYE
jgi:hypothetical protein